ncbi:MAG: hypothetical protein K9H49_00605 [Bacteroidales bacterium]|nr:hypothetical protein [Bacteroidales bacterium]MCF8389856.1 hypothetical protein [Bacteroidales bacterium]
MIRVLNYIFIFLVVIATSSCTSEVNEYELTDDLATIYPDYTNITIPRNMGPMNFQIQEEGIDFKAHIYTKTNSVWVDARENKIIIPQNKWRNLVNDSRDDTLIIDLFRKDKHKIWYKYPQIRNAVSHDNIDEYIVYRKLPPANILWSEMGIYQQSLLTLTTKPILTNTITDKNCINCHSFSSNDPNRMMFHMRAKNGGTLISYDNTTKLINTNSEHIGSAGAYPSWHPSGKFIAFSVNRIAQDFHSHIEMTALVYDKFSDIVLYDIENNTITRPRELATGALENMPSWSPDGRKLYYISAPELNDSSIYSELKYSLYSIEFDPETKSFGKTDTILEAGKINKSISFPRMAADNNTLSMCLLDYGYFSIYNKESDIYTYTLDSKKLNEIKGNSNEVESYPSWSQNGKWLMFVSKREDGVLSKIYFSHLNEDGSTSKAFLAPQKDPRFYDDYLLNFNRPEFAITKVELNPRKLLKIVKSEAQNVDFDLNNSVSISTGPTKQTKEHPEGFYEQDK